MILLLAAAALAGTHALVPVDVWIREAPEPDATGARVDPDPGRPVALRTLEVVAVQDGWVQVRTLPAYAAQCHTPLVTAGARLLGWVRRAELATVATHEVTVDGGAGTRVTVGAGLAVATNGDGHRVDRGSWSLDVMLPADALGTTFDPQDVRPRAEVDDDTRRLQPGGQLRASDGTFALTAREPVNVQPDGGRAVFADRCVEVAGVVAGPTNGDAPFGGGAVGGILKSGQPSGWRLPAGTSLHRPDGTPAGTMEDAARVIFDRGAWEVGGRWCVPWSLAHGGEGGLTVCFDGAVAERVGGDDPAVDAASGPRPFHPSQLTVKRHPPPRFPRDEVLPAARCVVHVVMDDQGTPVDVRAEQCPEGFAREAESAVRDWRWKPPPIDRGTQASTVVGVSFQRR